MFVVYGKNELIDTRKVIPEFIKLRFIDLFAGIGGIRRGFEDSSTRCVFSSEWDKYAVKTYEANYGETPYGDITKINEKDIPDHDVLLAGFPCQPFSNIGKREGFSHKTQGTLFFDVLRILKEKEPTITSHSWQDNNFLKTHRIRKLTPLECWRLQGFTDGQFYKAKNAGISDSQLYKQAGNAVAVNVIYEIGKRLKGEKCDRETI